MSRRIAVAAEGTGGVKPLRMAVAAILSPEGTIESYAALAEFLEEALQRPVEIVQRRTYDEINDLLESGEAEIGFVCTSAYVTGHDSFGLELLAAPEIGDEAVYHSELIVPADSAASSIADLRGARFAFTDPISTTGRVYPTYLVQELGEDPSTFFSSTFFTYSHDRAIEAVAEGLADGAAVDSLVLDYALARDPDLRSAIRVIHRSPAFGIPPVVASPALTATQKAEIKALLLSLADEPAARPVLEALGIDRFVHIDDAAYDSVREVFAAVEGGR
jgi:phosphonate transport system substrate-binding protein